MQTNEIPTLRALGDALDVRRPATTALMLRSVKRTYEVVNTG